MLSGKTVVVTGANSGIGLEFCVKAAKEGAKIVMACRDVQRSEPARADIIARSATSLPVELVPLDVSSLASVKAFPSLFSGTIDVLVCNAGIMAPDKSLSKDGVEMQFATNVLGHYALLCALSDRLAASGARVVMVSSAVHAYASGINLQDINRERSYSRWGVYFETKLADLLLMHKYNRIMKAAGSASFAVGCHPGYAATNLQSPHFFFVWMNKIIAQSQEDGALPTMLAASDPEAKPGMYAGPDSWGGMRGNATWGVSQNKLAYDEKLQDDLWAKCEELSGCKLQV